MFVAVVNCSLIVWYLAEADSKKETDGRRSKKNHILIVFVPQNIASCCRSGKSLKNVCFL